MAHVGEDPVHLGEMVKGVTGVADSMYHPPPTHPSTLKLLPFKSVAAAA